MTLWFGAGGAHVVDASRTWSVLFVGASLEFSLDETGVFLRSLHEAARRECLVLNAETLELKDLTLDVHSEEQIGWDTWAAVQ